MTVVAALVAVMLFVLVVTQRPALTADAGADEAALRGDADGRERVDRGSGSRCA
jgi:hypothetical protein